MCLSWYTIGAEVVSGMKQENKAHELQHRLPDRTCPASSATLVGVARVDLTPGDYKSHSQQKNSSSNMTLSYLSFCKRSGMDLVYNIPCRLIERLSKRTIPVSHRTFGHGEICCRTCSTLSPVRAEASMNKRPIAARSSSLRSVCRWGELTLFLCPKFSLLLRNFSLIVF